MIFWTLDAMALRDEAYLTSAWQQHSRSGSGRGRGAWKAPAGAPQSDSGALRYRRLLLAGREDADTCDFNLRYYRYQQGVIRLALLLL